MYSILAYLILKISVSMQEITNNKMLPDQEHLTMAERYMYKQITSLAVGWL